MPLDLKKRLHAASIVAFSSPKCSVDSIGSSVKWISIFVIVRRLLLGCWLKKVRFHVAIHSALK